MLELPAMRFLLTWIDLLWSSLLTRLRVVKLGFESLYGLLMLGVGILGVIIFCLVF